MSDGRRATTVVLITYRELNIFGTGLALDVATPVELALAPLLHRRLDRGVAAAATHLVATLGSFPALHASPSVCAWNERKIC